MKKARIKLQGFSTRGDLSIPYKPEEAKLNMHKLYEIWKSTIDQIDPYSTSKFRKKILISRDQVFHYTDHP